MISVCLFIIENNTLICELLDVIVGGICRSLK